MLDNESGSTHQHCCWRCCTGCVTTLGRPSGLGDRTQGLRPKREQISLVLVFSFLKERIVRGLECLVKCKGPERNRARSVCIWESTLVRVVAGAQTREGGPSPEQRRRRPRALAAPRPPHLSPFLPGCIPACRLARWGGPRDFLGSTLTARGRGGYTPRLSQEGNDRGWGDLCLRRDDRRPEAGVWLT